MAESRRKLVIDCDPGTDDVQAILMALESPEVEIMAITTTFGNSTVENTSLNALKALKIMDRLDIPVYKGCSTALNGTTVVSEGYHGRDGLGDVPHLYQADPSSLQKEHSVLALVNLVNKYPGEITLVALGPLTNIAISLQLDPLLGRKIKDCVIMGGNTTGKGNITKTAEFNFYSDPDAVAKVFKDLKTDIILVPMELCKQYSLSWDWYEKYISQATPKGVFVKETDKVLVSNHKRLGAENYWTWDQLAMAIVINKHVAFEIKKAKVNIELHEEGKRGMMIVDWNSNQTNSSIITKVDMKKFEKEINKAVS